MVAFAHPWAAGWDDQEVANAGNVRLEIGCDLFDWIGAGAPGNDEYLVEVVVEEDRKIMPSGQFVAGPRAVNRLGAKELQASAVDVGEDIKRAVVIANARCPDATAIDATAIFQTVGRAQVKPVRAVADEFPVHQVFRVHQLHGGIHVHGGAGEVVVLTDTDHVRVLELLVKQWIGVGAIAIVGGPMMGRDRRGRRCKARPGSNHECECCRDQRGEGDADAHQLLRSVFSFNTVME